MRDRFRKAGLLLGVFAPLMVAMGAETAGAEALMCRVPQASASRSPSSDTVPGTPAIKIIQLDPDFPIKELELEGYETVSFDQFTELDPWAAPDPVLRDQIFHAAGLNRHLKGWDHFKRDLLFLRAQEQSVETLARKYPEIPQKVLKTLVRVIEDEKKKRGQK